MLMVAPSSVTIPLLIRVELAVVPIAIEGFGTFSGGISIFAADVDPASDERFRDGWYYPGDYAHLDDAGYIFLRGRAGDAIARNGIELFPAEIEAVIAQHPDVAEVAVAGVPRPVPGDELVALVVPQGQTQHELIAQFCQSRLPSERRPDRIFYTPALPKTAGGKLDRAQVRTIIMDEISRRAGQ